MSDFTPRPGHSVDGYDVTTRLGTDYYGVFADIPAADREVWGRAQAYIDEVWGRWEVREFWIDEAGAILGFLMPADIR